MTSANPDQGGVILVVDGAVENVLLLGYDDLAALPVEDQIADVSELHPGRKGAAVDLRALPRPLGAEA